MYTDKKQIRAEIEGIELGFIWEANQFEVSPKMLATNPTLRMLSLQARFDPIKLKRFQKEIVTEYCWLAYSKSIASTGDMVIGRQADMNRQGLYGKVAELVRQEIGPQTKHAADAEAARFGNVAPNRTFLDEGVHGNLQNMDKWAAPVNDAWLLGGVHRRAKFRLASPRIMENLWNTAGHLVVTAREIIGLLCFGYELYQVGPWQVFLLNKDDEHKALSATLTQYANHLKTRGTIAEAEKLKKERLGANAGVQKVRFLS
jgi:hypothetical protein